MFVVHRFAMVEHFFVDFFKSTSVFKKNADNKSVISVRLSSGIQHIAVWVFFTPASGDRAQQPVIIMLFSY